MTEEELVESLTGVCLLSGSVKQPKARKVAREALLDLCGLVVALRRRVERLEDRPELKYRGVWRADEEYTVNSAVTHDGSVFIARAQSVGVRPGDGDLWQLAVKRGRDARAQVIRTSDDAAARKDK